MKAQERPCDSTDDQERPCDSTDDQERPCDSTDDKERPCDSSDDQERPCDSTDDQKRLCDYIDGQEDTKGKECRNPYRMKHLWRMLFMCMLVLAVLPILILYRAAGHGGPGSLCDRAGWKWVKLWGPCWNSLITLPATTTWYDITILTGYGSILLCLITTVVLRCTESSKKSRVERCCNRIIVGVSSLIMVLTIGVYFCFEHLQAPDISEADVSNQLLEALQVYNHDDVITRAWQNTMRDGCCCGVHGYKDFTDIGMEVSVYCGCYDERQPPALFEGCFIGSYLGCTVADNTTFTSAGCLEFVVENVALNTGVMTVILFVFVMFCSGVIFASADCYNVDCTCGGDGVTVAGVHEDALQRKMEIKSVYSFKGSLLRKLVLTTILFIPVTLVFALVGFYWYHLGPTVCSLSQVEDYLTPWVSPYTPSPCWTDLVYYDQEINWFDGILSFYVGFLFACSFGVLIGVVQCRKTPRKVSTFKRSINLITISSICYLLLLAGGIVFFNSFRSSIYSTDLRDNIRMQLEYSLPLYDADGFRLREAWDNTMEDGCCCGVDGYQDFNNLNMSIPAACQSQHHFCDIYLDSGTVLVDGNETFSLGCLDSIMASIDYIEERSTTMFLFLSIFITLILLIVVAITKCCLIKTSKSIFDDNKYVKLAEKLNNISSK